MMNKKILLYILLGIVVLALVLFTLFPNMIYLVKDSGFTGNAVSQEDKCTPPTGVSLEEWQTHMSHHPNIYKECLS